jgi:hypothetical protein
MQEPHKANVICAFSHECLGHVDGGLGAPCNSGGRPILGPSVLWPLGLHTVVWAPSLACPLVSTSFWGANVKWLKPEALCDQLLLDISKCVQEVRIRVTWEWGAGLGWGEGREFRSWDKGEGDFRPQEWVVMEKRARGILRVRDQHPEHPGKGNSSGLWWVGPGRKRAAKVKMPRGLGGAAQWLCSQLWSP